LTARERIDALLDADSPRIEIGLWSGFEMYPDAGGTVAAAGVVVVVGSVQRRPTMVIANDATVKAGAFFPATAKKVLRAQTIAFACGLPIAYLVDSAGVYLPMQDEVFPDEDDFGRIFRNNAVLSAAGLPQFSAVMGNCVAGGAYLPVLSDTMLMTRDSEVYLAGPALVKAAIGQVADAGELGGAEMHAAVSGTADFVEADDDACLERLKSLISVLPAEPESPAATPGADGADDPQSVYDLVDPSGRREYDVRDVLRTIHDADAFDEYKADYGRSLVCGYARLAGRPVGIVANQKTRVTTGKGEVQVGGVIYHDSADKAARFVMDCDQKGLPILFFQDVSGFMVGTRSEQAGVIRSGAKLVNAVSNCRVPKITTVLGGSFGAGNYALCGKAFDPTFIFAWPNAKYAVMGAAQAAGTLVQLEKRRLGEDADVAELTERVTADYERQTDIRYGAARGWVDAVIQPHKTREVLAHALSLASRPRPQGGFRGGVLQV
jgi:acetyl-CoA carboxylase carboxyltransferase component